MNKRVVKVLALALSAVLGMGMLAACGTSTSTAANSNANTNKVANVSANSSNASNANSNASSSSKNTSNATNTSSANSGTYSSEGHELHHATVSVEGYDPFTITLDATVAPITVQNFIDLANSGFYDGLTFHRIVDSFCLQGGDPKGNGTGGSSNTIKGEFSGNGVDNALADNFARGVVAMARSSAADSASSQFFVTLSSSSSVSASLNGKYAAFGTIDDDGMKVVDAIVAEYKSKASGSSGTISSTADQPKITSIAITD